MAYKPVGIDENGDLPPRAQAALDARYVIHVDPSDDMQAALDQADGTTDITIVMRPGALYTVEATWAVGALTTIEGNGAVVKAADGLDADVIASANPATGDPSITLRNLIVDGNASGQTNTLPAVDHLTAGTAVAGITLRRCSDLSLENVRVRNVNGRGVFLSGEGDHTRNVRLVNVSATGNAFDGLWIGNAMRGVQYLGVSASGNGRHGVVIDHSEANTASVWAYGNDAYGIVIRNVQACDFQGLHATVNGEHGIYVLGLLYSRGGAWLAQNNGQADTGGAGALGYADVYFTADTTSPGYGSTTYTEIDGISAGYNPTTLTQGVARREAYSVYIEDGLAAAELKLTGVQPVTGGLISDVRLPASPTRLYVESFPGGSNRRVVLAGTDYIRNGGGVRLEGTSTANRPSPSAAGAGFIGWDSTLGKPIYSDGTYIISGKKAYAQSKATSYTMTADDEMILANGSGITITLPGPGTLPNGHTVVVKNQHASSLTVTSTGAPSKTIDGATSITLAQWESVTLVNIGAQWYIAARA